MLGIYEKAMPNTLSIREKLELAKTAGFDYMEISIDESDEKLARLDFSKEEINRIRKDIYEVGLPIYSLCLSGHRKYPLGSRDQATRQRSLEMMQKAIDLCVALGIRLIQIAGYDVYYEKGGTDTEEYFISNLKKSVSMAAQKGIILAFEIMETPFMNTIQKAMKFVRIIKSPYLQIYPDMGNVRNGTDDYLSDIECGRGHLAAAHLKETVEGVYRDMLFGEGRVDFEGCLQALQEQGVGLYVCEMWYDGKSEPLEYIRNARRFFKNLK